MALTACGLFLPLILAKCVKNFCTAELFSPPLRKAGSPYFCAAELFPPPLRKAGSSYFCTAELFTPPLQALRCSNSFWNGEILFSFSITTGSFSRT